MNRSMARALLEDALHQVFDNMVFRLLLIVVLGLVAPTFLVGFREEGVQILWGWQELSYEQIFGWIGRSAKVIKDPQGEAIQLYQTLVVDGLCGSIGMVFCVAATAFFVPRMLEKGSADVLFSKPLSRTTLLLARYFSGILFVGLLAFALVLGMYVGFLLVSGYGDTGSLWGALTLVYLFAIVHGVSTLAGVLTRSTVASILIALVFFVGTGRVHWMWRIRAYIQQTELVKKLRQQSESSPEAEINVPTILDDDPGTLAKLLLLTLDTAHFTLPKTSDAGMMMRKFRKAIERQGVPIVDDEIHLTIPGPPEGLELSRKGLPSASGGRIPADLSERPVVWIRLDEKGTEVARIEISRRSRLVDRPGASDGNGKARPRRLSATAAAEEWLERARSAGTLDSETAERKGRVDQIQAVFIGWYERLEGGRSHRQVAVFATGDAIVEVSETADPDWLTPDERAAHLERFLDGFQIAREADFEDPADWFERRFSPTAPLPFNVYFSIGSSIAFTLLALAFGAWKLSRADF